ncbi:hypothetical protein K501DRAFT_327602 [Backusella circina FSU 941]|nr:hypothetical protein K501DRAFT_327602 [Backusella circina FSU 941]
MSMFNEERPTLPSIQFLLQDNSAPKRQSRHAPSKSLSSLPQDLATLSLFEHKSEETKPSWIQEKPPPQPVHTRGHNRSTSDYTLPPLPSLVPPSSSAHSRHRRTVSANTVDFMTNSHHSPLRSHSYSPQDTHLVVSSSIPSTGEMFEQIIDNNIAGKYICPYCQKKFSRPSSLRIHTYSHTGEKPFKCTEPGCGRHFSVQSNMRRHLRVHRLDGRSVSGILEHEEQ